MNHRSIALVLTGGAVAAAAAQLWVAPASRQTSLSRELVAAAFEDPADLTPDWARVLLDDPRSDPEMAILDVEVSGLSGLQQRARVGSYPSGRIGTAGSTTSCNIGTVDVPWFRQMDPRHPFIAQNMYRVDPNGRLYQIGIAWLKHGFFAADASGCGNCNGNLQDNHLNVGCQDTYGSGNNSDRTWLGPRFEVDPLTGAWEPCGSHFDIGNGSQPDCRESSHSHGAIDHMLRIDDADLDVQGAQFYYESYYVIANDENNLNNASYRRATVSRSTNTWSFSHPESMVRGLYVMNWGDYHHFVNDRTHGDAIIATRVIDLGQGNYRYEYAVYNHTLWQQINSFSIEVGSGVTISNAGFHAPVEDEEPYGNEAWTMNVAANSVSWSVDDFNTNEFSNTLRYGTVYTFWFDANAAPVASGATLGLHKPGDLSSIRMGCVTPGRPANTEAAGLTMTMPNLRRGQAATWTVTGLRPGERVYLAYSEAGFSDRVIGLGPTRLDALALDVELLRPGVIFASLRANQQGVATLTATVPPDAPLVSTAFQAVAPRGRGTSVKSNVELRTISN